MSQNILISSKLLLIRNWLLNTRSNIFDTTIDIFNMYTRGGFGSAYETAGQTIFNIAKPGLRQDFFRGSSSTFERLVEKWDTTGDAISSQAASNFIKALLPLSEKSITLKFTHLREILLNEFAVNNTKNRILDELSAVENHATYQLQQLLNSKYSNFNEQLFANVRDYLDYGNSILMMDFSVSKIGRPQYYFRNLDFTNTYFWREKHTHSFAVLNVRRQFNFLIKREYPAYLPGMQQEDFNIQQTLKDVYRIYLTRDYVDDNIIDLTEIIKQFPSRDIGVAEVFEFTLVDSMLVGFKPYLYNPIFIATIGQYENAYGYGDGLSALGAIMMSNFSIGSQYLTVQKLNAPPIIASSKTIIESDESSVVQNRGLITAGQINYNPGALTKIGDSSGVPPMDNLGNLIQPLPVTYQQLNAFIELNMNSQKILADSYKAGTMSMNVDIPNETAMATSTRVGQTIRNFTSRAENYCQSVMYQITGQINRNHNLNEPIKVGAILMDAGLEDLGINHELETDIESWVKEAQKQLAIIELQQEMQIKLGLAQMAQGLPEDDVAAMQEKIDDIFS